MSVATAFFLGVITVQLILFVIMVVTGNLSIKYLNEKDYSKYHRYSSINDFCFGSVITIFVMYTVLQILG